MWLEAMCSTTCISVGASQPGTLTGVGERVLSHCGGRAYPSESRGMMTLERRHLIYSWAVLHTRSLATNMFHR